MGHNKTIGKGKKSIITEGNSVNAKEKTRNYIFFFTVNLSKQDIDLGENRKKHLIDGYKNRGG